MTQYNIVNAKLSNSQINNLKFGIKNENWSKFESFIIFNLNL